MNEKTVSVTELRRDLHTALREVQANTSIIITHRGRPVAVMVNPAVYETLRGDELSPAWPAGYFEETYGAWLRIRWSVHHKGRTSGRSRCENRWIVPIDCGIPCT
ncbi:MAG: type II toxin-antitoxin system Phd/YefM family antitoxin [Caldilineaceae bacterium]|nr:type II toxin-antitoxin system Phd/YefM family antitoxin [Caldilineaceae bacterium]